jgi:signal transduction histidine kinase
MPHGGTITFRTYGDAERVVVEVADTGVGMTEEVRRRCTETHFSTKRDNALYEGLSAGMGLGLSFVAVILEHHGAELEIDSEPLKGATFRVRFPSAGG